MDIKSSLLEYNALNVRNSFHRYNHMARIIVSKMCHTCLKKLSKQSSTTSNDKMARWITCWHRFRAFFVSSRMFRAISSDKNVSSPSPCPLWVICVMNSPILLIKSYTLPHDPKTQTWHKQRCYWPLPLGGLLHMVKRGIVFGKNIPTHILQVACLNSASSCKLN